MPATKKRQTKRVIKFRPELFWDVNPKNINPKKHAKYVIERILDFGNTQEVRWLRRYYPEKFLTTTVKKSRALDPKSRSLWSLIFR